MIIPPRRAVHLAVLLLAVFGMVLPAEDHRPEHAGAEGGGTPTTLVSEESDSAETGEPRPLATPVVSDGATAADEPTSAAVSASQGLGEFRIGPDNAGTGAPGASILYSHVVTNDGALSMVLNVVAVSSLGWTVGLFEADGMTPLGDHDGDGRPDTGELAAGESRSVVVLVVVAADAWAGDSDITTVTVSSAGDPGVAVSASNRTTVNPVLGLAVAPAELAFGRVAADGRVDPAVTGIVGEADETGAYYVGVGLVSVTVVSNAPWSGSCSAVENTGTASAVTIAGGRLEWRLSGTETWTPFAVAGGASSASFALPCFPAEAAGTATFVYDVRLRVERTDRAGTFSTRIVYSAAH